MEISDDGTLLVFWHPEAPPAVNVYLQALRSGIPGPLCVALDRTEEGWRVNVARSPPHEDRRLDVARLLRVAGLPVDLSEWPAFRRTRLRF